MFLNRYVYSPFLRFGDRSPRHPRSDVRYGVDPVLEALQGWILIQRGLAEYVLEVFQRDGENEIAPSYLEYKALRLANGRLFSHTALNKTIDIVNLYSFGIHRGLFRGIRRMLPHLNGRKSFPHLEWIRYKNILFQ